MKEKEKIRKWRSKTVADLGSIVWCFLRNAPSETSAAAAAAEADQVATTCSLQRSQFKIELPTTSWRSCVAPDEIVCALVRCTRKLPHIYTSLIGASLTFNFTCGIRDMHIRYMYVFVCTYVRMYERGTVLQYLRRRGWLGTLFARNTEHGCSKLL
jgi:hypothetical protein